MGKHVVTGGFFSLGGTDLSSDVMSVSLTREWDEVESTTFGETERSYVIGLATAQLSVTFAQDYDASGLYETLDSLAGGTTTFSMRPFSTAVSTSNPQWDGTVNIASITDIDASQGDLSTNTVSAKAFNITKSTV